MHDQLINGTLTSLPAITTALRREWAMMGLDFCERTSISQNFKLYGIICRPICIRTKLPNQFYKNNNYSASFCFFSTGGVTWTLAAFSNACTAIAFTPAK